MKFILMPYLRGLNLLNTYHILNKILFNFQQKIETKTSFLWIKTVQDIVGIGETIRFDDAKICDVENIKFFVSYHHPFSVIIDYY